MCCRQGFVLHLVGVDRQVVLLCPQWLVQAHAFVVWQVHGRDDDLVRGPIHRFDLKGGQAWRNGA